MQVTNTISKLSGSHEAFPLWWMQLYVPEVMCSLYPFSRETFNTKNLLCHWYPWQVLHPFSDHHVKYMSQDLQFIIIIFNFKSLLHIIDFTICQVKNFKIPFLWSLAGMCLTWSLPSSCLLLTKKVTEQTWHSAIWFHSGSELDSVGCA